MTDIVQGTPDSPMASAREATAREATAREATAREATAREATAREATAPFLAAPDDAAPTLVAAHHDAAPTLVPPPQFSESALTKPRPGPQQLAVQQIAALAVATSAAASAGFSAQAVVAAMPAPSASPSLRTRIAGFAVMTQCLRAQSAAPERSRLARVFGREPLHPDARSWYRGAIGEIEVARILSRLDRRWTVLHAVPVGSAGADIDHVVIGPAGTFTINTKNHSGKKIWTAGTSFMVNGQKLAHIHNSTFEAKRAARLLSDMTATPVAVTPLIVVVRPEKLTRKNPDVTVMESTELLRWLARQPQMQTDATVARIVWAAERRETWTTLVDDVPESRRAGRPDSGAGYPQNGRAAHPGSGRSATRSVAVAVAVAAGDCEARFDKLRAEVETAEARRQAWSLLGAAAFLAAVIASAMLIAPAVPQILTELMGGA